MLLNISLFNPNVKHRYKQNMLLNSITSNQKVKHMDSEYKQLRYNFIELLRHTIYFKISAKRKRITKPNRIPVTNGNCNMVFWLVTETQTSVRTQYMSFTLTLSIICLCLTTLNQLYKIGWALTHKSSITVKC